MQETFNGLFNGLTVLITGHTGFKGSWLSIWLRELGAKVVGYSLDPPTHPSNFEVCQLKDKITHIQGDIRDKHKLKSVIDQYKPEVVFHLAAQALVLHSYEFPSDTFEINSQGTVNLLEIARSAPFIKTMVVVTTDKCYENKEWVWGYRESDPLGGSDPYSASKAMAELAVNAYRRSFFSKEDSPLSLASARAGNVIGGGDFSDFRIVPDTMKALMKEAPIAVRNPDSVRPWLNVLDPLSGYLWLAARSLEKGKSFAEAWNFGPKEHAGIPVRDLVDKAIELWGSGSWATRRAENLKPEMGLLRLDWSKAASSLSWQPVYDWKEAVEETVDWFKSYQQQENMYEVCVSHIQKYTKKASDAKVPWATLEEACASLKPL